MKKAILIVGLLVLAVVNSFAQTQVEPLSSFKVGDVVYYGYENEWTLVRIASINLPIFQVVRSNGYKEGIEASPRRIIQSEKGHERFLNGKKNEQTFQKEIGPYMRSIQLLSKAYDFKMVWVSGSTYPIPSSEDAWTQILADLQAVDQLCKKYGPFPEPKYKPNYFAGYSNGYCALAADPVHTKMQGMQVVVDGIVQDSTGVLGKDVRADYTDFGGSDNQIPDRFQEMVFETQQFRKKVSDEITAEFAKRGAPVPPTWMDLYWGDYEKLIAKTKERIRQTMSSTSFQTGTAKDPVLEKTIRAGYAKLPNASKIQILRVVFKNTSWSTSSSYTYKGSDSKYDYYKVGKGTSLRGGYVIAKVEGRPDCQAREFNFFKAPGSGAKLDFLTIGGRFIPCP